MTTVLFIHGTGSRDPQAQATYERISDGIHREHPGIRVERCYWGPFGAPRKDPYLSVAFADGSDSADEGEGDVALWGQLLADPLFEIRLRQVARRRSTDLFGTKVRDQVGEIPSDPGVLAALAANGLIPEEIAAAVTQVADTPEFREVYGSVVNADGDAVGVLSRALIAACLNAAAERGHEVTGQARDELVRVIAARAFGGAPDAGIGDRLGDLAKSIALHAAPVAARAVPPAATRKGQAAAIRAAGDILVYQSRGKAIRGFVRDAISQLDDDKVILLAHSLGGIIAFDLLAGSGLNAPCSPDHDDAAPGSLDKVRMLVTVGSQVPLFYELGALACGITEETGLPGGFVVPWLNIYDRRDLLAYAGRGLFGNRCQDKLVDTRTPFPMAHSAYWAEEGLYAWLTDRMEEAGLCQ